MRTFGLAARALLLAVLFAPAAANAFQATMYEFAVAKNRAPLYLDSFTDGIPPPAPSGPLLQPPNNSVIYGVQGSYAGSENPVNGGTLTLDTANGIVAPPFTPGVFSLFLVQSATLLTNTDPASGLGLKPGSTFATSGVFDVVQPDVQAPVGVPLTIAGGYGIALQSGSDRVTLTIARDGAGASLTFNRLDSASSQTFQLDSVPLVLGRQVELELVRASTASNDVTAFYRYVGDASFTQLSGAAAIFQTGQWAQAQFRIFTPVPEPGTLTFLAVGALALVWAHRKSGQHSRRAALSGNTRPIA